MFPQSSSGGGRNAGVQFVPCGVRRGSHMRVATLGRSCRREREMALLVAKRRVRSTLLVSGCLTSYTRCSFARTDLWRPFEISLGWSPRMQCRGIVWTACANSN
jgi:hypothetical protein